MNKEIIQFTEQASKAEQNKKRLENSGIVNVFKGLIENESVAMDRSENKKAEIAWSKAGKDDQTGDNSKVMLIFDRTYITSHGGHDTYYKALVAQIGEGGEIKLRLSRNVVNGYPDVLGNFDNCYFSERKQPYFYSGSRNDVHSDVQITPETQEQAVVQLLNR